MDEVKVIITMYDGHDTYAKRMCIRFDEDVEFKKGDTLIIDGYLAPGDFLKFYATKVERYTDATKN